MKKLGRLGVGRRVLRYEACLMDGRGFLGADSSTTPDATPRLLVWPKQPLENTTKRIYLGILSADRSNIASQPDFQKECERTAWPFAPFLKCFT